MVKVSRFEAVDSLDSEEMIEECLAAAKECENPDVLRAGLSDVAKAHAAAQLAKNNPAQQG